MVGISYTLPRAWLILYSDIFTFNRTFLSTFFFLCSPRLLVFFTILRRNRNFKSIYASNVLQASKKQFNDELFSGLIHSTPLYINCVFFLKAVFLVNFVQKIKIEKFCNNA